MTIKEQHELGKTLWRIADDLRGSMMADDFRDYMLSFLFLPTTKHMSCYIVHSRSARLITQTLR